MKENFEIVKKQIDLVADRYYNEELTFEEMRSELTIIRERAASAMLLGLLTEKENLDLIMCCGEVD